MPEDSQTLLVISRGGQHIEQLRSSLNAAYSAVPPELDELFYAALDQIADQQFKVTKALTDYISLQDQKEAEQIISVAVAEAQRTALRAARAHADYQAASADEIYTGLQHIPTDFSDLANIKKKLDEKFKNAAVMHENDALEAFEPLLEVAVEYKNLGSDAQLRIFGAQGIIESDLRRLRLQTRALYTALALGVISSILGLINLLLNYWR